MALLTTLVIFVLTIFFARKGLQSWVISIGGAIIFSIIWFFAFAMFSRFNNDGPEITFKNISSYKVKIYSQLCEECNNDLSIGESFTIRGYKKALSMTSFEFSPANLVREKSSGDTIYFENRN